MVRVVTQPLISEVNTVARDYAKAHAAELVGTKWYDGERGTDPSEKWPITESTRSVLRKIITDAFEHEGRFSELVQKIKDAGDFSDERAKIIAHTEVKFAQVRGNYEGWRKSGLVKKVKWLLIADHCETDLCDLNHDAGSVEFGKPFPSGDYCPPQHPGCRCSIVATEVGGLSQKW